MIKTHRSQNLLHECFYITSVVHSCSRLRFWCVFIINKIAGLNDQWQQYPKYDICESSQVHIGVGSNGRKSLGTYGRVNRRTGQPCNLALCVRVAIYAGGFLVIVDPFLTSRFNIFLVSIMLLGSLKAPFRKYWYKSTLETPKTGGRRGISNYRKRSRGVPRSSENAHPLAPP